MQAQPGRDSGENHLRFVFDDEVVSFTISREATLGDVAGRFAHLALQHEGMPVAIDLTFGSRSQLTVRQPGALTSRCSH